MNVCIGVVENCKNPESYGTICVKCNMCGRFNKQTNADKIRAMSDEELAKELICGEFVPSCPLKAPHCMSSDCEPCFLKWLKQEVIT